MANEDVVEEIEVRGLTDLAEALSYLLHKEFGHVLRPSEDMAWHKAACGILLGLEPEEWGSRTYVIHAWVVKELINKKAES